MEDDKRAVNYDTICPFRPSRKGKGSVFCTTAEIFVGRCDKCGWNPAVEEARIGAIKEKRRKK